VGDDDQSLYRFRGAVVNLFKFFPERIKQFLKLKQLPTQIYLMENYRSTPSIIKFYNEFVQIDESYYKNPPAARIEKKDLVTCGLLPQFKEDPKKYSDYPVLFMLRDDVETLAKDLSELIYQIFEEDGFKGQVKGADGEIHIEIVRARKEPGNYADLSILSSSPAEFNSSGNRTLTYYLRQNLEESDIKVFNPRGFEINQKLEVQTLLGLMLICLDPSQQIQSSLHLFDDNEETLNIWRTNANHLLEKCKNIPTSTYKEHQFWRDLPNYVEFWGLRKPRVEGKQKAWPDSFPLLELVYKLSSWIPADEADFPDWDAIFSTEPEYALYLESIVGFLNKIAEFSPYHGEFVKYIRKPDKTKEDVEKQCISSLYREFFVEIANGALELNEDIIDAFPTDRVNIMSIHQSKGLEFPLVIVDVCSGFKTNHSAQRFKRFPDKLGDIYALEEYYAKLLNAPSDKRTSLDHAFDDLIRLYFVAFSRPQSLLILTGINPETRALRDEGKFIPNIAVGFDRKENHPWSRENNKYPWYFL
jgi:DNA helicase-2/ATP-dependent DNA helicase PcrA